MRHYKRQKLDALGKVFYVTPPPPPPPAPELVSIKKASKEEIVERLNYLSTYEIGGFETLNTDELTELLFTTDKSKWKSLNPITKMDCGVDTAKVKVLKTVFTV